MAAAASFEYAFPSRRRIPALLWPAAWGPASRAACRMPWLPRPRVAPTESVNWAIILLSSVSAFALNHRAVVITLRPWRTCSAIGRISSGSSHSHNRSNFSPSGPYSGAVYRRPGRPCSGVACAASHLPRHFRRSRRPYPPPPPPCSRRRPSPPLRQRLRQPRVPM